jgi:hypothetical protein
MYGHLGKAQESHHVFPKYLFGSKNNTITIRLARDEHRLLTTLFQRRWAYGDRHRRVRHEEVLQFTKDMFDGHFDHLLSQL